MRDVHHFVKEQTMVSNGNTYHYPRNVTRSQREDAVSTKPLSSGTFVRPTVYEAFFGTTTEVPGSAEWRKHNWPYRPNMDYSYHSAFWDGGSDHDAIYHGCDKVSLHPVLPWQTIAKARNGVLSKVRNNDFNVGQTLAEARETVGTVATLGAAYGSYFRALNRNRNFLGRLLSAREFAQLGRMTIRRARELGLKESSRRAAGSYLWFMYGVRPLMNDIWSLLQVIEDGLGQGEVAQVTSVAMDESFSLPSWSNRSDDRKAKGTVKRGVECSATIGITNPTRYQLWRYGLTDPLSLAWELTTLSFVVDWFTGVGDFLGGLQQPLGVKFYHGYETHFLENNIVIRSNGFPQYSFYNRTEVLKEGYVETPVRTKAMRRLGLYEFAIPLPYFDMGLNTSQITSAIALLRQRI